VGFFRLAFGDDPHFDVRRDVAMELDGNRVLAEFFSASASTILRLSMSNPLA